MGVKEILERKKGQKTWGQLADELGVTRQTLYNVFTERHEPSRKLMKALGLEVRLVKAR
jgi:DNA-binding XRE family transcriptional regulator